MLLVRLKLLYLHTKLFLNKVLASLIRFFSIYFSNKNFLIMNLLFLFCLINCTQHCNGQTNSGLDLNLTKVNDNVKPNDMNRSNSYSLRNTSLTIDYATSGHSLYYNETPKLDKTAHIYHKIRDVFVAANDEISYNFKVPDSINKPGNYFLLVVDDDNGDIVEVIKIKQTNEGNVIFINKNFNHVIYTLLAFIIICLLLHIYKKPDKKPGFSNYERTSNIDQLILKDKIELALEKLYLGVKHNDEKLRNEILLLSNELFSYNRDRLSGILCEEDYSIRKNKIVSRTIGISNELKLV